MFITTYIFGGTALALLLGFKLASPNVAVISYIIIMLSPFVFQKQFWKNFIKKAILNFDKERLVIERVNRKTNDSEGIDVDNFNELNSYVASSLKNDFLRLTFKSFNGPKIKYTFIEKKARL